MKNLDNAGEFVVRMVPLSEPNVRPVAGQSVICEGESEPTTVYRP